MKEDREEKEGRWSGVVEAGGSDVGRGGRKER